MGERETLKPSHHEFSLLGYLHTYALHCMWCGKKLKTSYPVTEIAQNSWVSKPVSEEHCRQISMGETETPRSSLPQVNDYQSVSSSVYFRLFTHRHYIAWLHHNPDNATNCMDITHRIRLFDYGRRRRLGNSVPECLSICIFWVKDEGGGGDSWLDTCKSSSLIVITHVMAGYRLMDTGQP